jgi:hypothetical protein
VQQCIATEHSETLWLASKYSKKALAENLALAADPAIPGVTASLFLRYRFERVNPPDENRFSKGNVTKNLNISLLEDCITSQ